MANRKIFTLNAWTVDSTGAWHQYTGTPKTFDSKNYDDDIDKAQKRAKGKFRLLRLSMKAGLISFILSLTERLRKLKNSNKE